MSQTLEQLAPNVTRRRDNALHTVLFEMKDTSRDSVDAYIEGNLEILRNQDKTQTLYTIQDISNPAVTLTPYLKERLNEVTAYIKNNKIQVCTAIVMADNFTGRVMRIFGRLFTINARYLTQVYFTDMSSARNWIASQQARKA